MQGVPYYGRWTWRQRGTRLRFRGLLFRPRSGRLLAEAARGQGARLGAVVSLHAVESVTLVAAGLGLAHRSTRQTLAAATLLGVLFALRSLVAGAFARQARVLLVEKAVRTLLESDVMTFPTGEDLYVTVHEGLYFGQQLVERFPPLLGGLVAAPVVTVVVALGLPRHLVPYAALALVLIAVAVVVARALTTPLLVAAQQAFSPVYDAVGCAIEGRVELVSSGHDDAFRCDLDQRLAHWKRVAARSDVGAALAGRAPALAAAFVVAFIVASDLWAGGAVTESTLGAAALAASALPTFLGLAKASVDSVRTTVRLRTFLSFLEMPSASTGWTSQKSLAKTPTSIEWRNVSFAYRTADIAAVGDVGAREPSPKPALRDVSVIWNSGELLVLRGPNGSGKSTLLRLLLGLARPSAGSLSIDGVDLCDLGLRAWRQTLAYLPQRPYMPERARLRDAIRITARDATDDQMHAALSRVGLWESLKARAPVPTGDPLDTRVGTLSVGQRQRAALARILCQRASVILLDEPDANLDAEGTVLVAKLVRELSHGRMVAVVAHGGAWDHPSDRVVELEDGALTVRPA